MLLRASVCRRAAAEVTQMVRRMAAEEFLAWQSSQGQRYELVDGEPVAMAGGRLRRDRVTGNAFSEIRRQLRAGPCGVFTGDIGIVTPMGNIRRPEVSVLCPPFDEEATSSDSPRLIVEVLSESTERVDRLIKLDEYKAIPALNSIIIVDPARIEVGFWLRDTSGLWQSKVFRTLEAVITIPSLGLAVSLASLYERVPVTPHPRPRFVGEDAAAAG